MLVSDPAVGRVIDDVRLRTGDFYLDRHRAIFEVMLDLYTRGDACDELTVRAAHDSAGRTDEIPTPVFFVVRAFFIFFLFFCFLFLCFSFFSVAF